MNFLKSLLGKAPQPAADQSLSLEEKLNAIDWFQFEKLVSGMFEPDGHKVTRRGGAQPDGGVDLIVHSTHGETLVQCKHWKAWNVGVRHVRELMGAMLDSGIHSAILITLRGYTADAKALAEKHSIVLLNASDVLQMIQELPEDRRHDLLEVINPQKKSCPKCERPMVLRTAKKGDNAGEQFWGCSGYPRCRYVLKV